MHFAELSRSGVVTVVVVFGCCSESFGSLWMFMANVGFRGVFAVGC